MLPPTLLAVHTPAPRAQWWRLLEEDGDALLEQGPAWADALAAAGRWRDCSRYYQFSDGRAFVLPLVSRLPSGFAPQSGFASSWGIGGLVGPAADPSVVSAIIADLAGLPALWVHLRPNPSQADLWDDRGVARVARLDRTAHVIDLRGTPAEVFDRFKSKTRRKVRRGMKLGVTTETFTGGRALDTYYNELFLPSVLRWADKQDEPGVLATMRAKRRDPLDKLMALATTLGDGFRLTLASVDGHIAAGNIVLDGPNAHYTRGAMNHHATKTDAASVALWTAIEHAADQGHRWFHMGESGDNVSLSAFKEGFGAAPVAYAEYRFERVPSIAVDRVAKNAVKRLIGFKD